jgi:Flp pilus assembly pilin Flp
MTFKAGVSARKRLTRFGKSESGAMSNEFVLVVAVISALAVGVYLSTREGAEVSNAQAMQELKTEGPDFGKLAAGQKAVQDEFK